MEKDKFVKNIQQTNKMDKTNKIIILILFLTIFIIFSYFLDYNKKLSKKYDQIFNQNNELFKKMENIENTIKKNFNLIRTNIFNISIKEEEFDENLNKKLIENQHHFCESDDLFIDVEIENKIKKVRAHLKNISFYMFVYKSPDYVSGSISGSGSWEGFHMYKIINCLDYYSVKKKLTKNEITVLDIGANVGWYSFYLANAGYELFSFEVSHINGYILKKNFCFNSNTNITIINKGIGEEEEKCQLHHPSGNVGNAVILCGENKQIARKREDLTEEVEFTKLSNYYNYLSKKNLALFKIDVEGTEGKVIKSGIDFIIKYHIPFLFIEFRNDYLKMQGTDPKEILEIFQQNDYLFSTKDFFSKKYSSIDEILKLKVTDLFIVYSNFLE